MAASSLEGGVQAGLAVADSAGANGSAAILEGDCAAEAAATDRGSQGHRLAYCDAGSRQGQGGESRRCLCAQGVEQQATGQQPCKLPYQVQQYENGSAPRTRCYGLARKHTVPLAPLVPAPVCIAVINYSCGRPRLAAPCFIQCASFIYCSTATGRSSR